MLRSSQSSHDNVCINIQLSMIVKYLFAPSIVYRYIVLVTAKYSIDSNCDYGSTRDYVYE